MYYSKSSINRADGLVTYIKNKIIENTEIVTIVKLKRINSKIKLEKKNQILQLSALYRCHEFPKTEFIFNSKQFIIRCQLHWQ